jgi:hypothetical protein
VLDHIECRRILEQPAGKDLVPGELFLGGLAILHEDLDEGTLFLRPFPGQGLLTRRHLDREVADAPGLARFHLQILRQVVALVENAESNDTVLVRRAKALALLGLRRSRLHLGNCLGNAGFLRLGLGFTPAASRKSEKAGGQRKSGYS